MSPAQATTDTTARDWPGDGLISIVIPVLNEEAGLDALLDRLLVTLDKTQKKFEVIFVDDGSSDATLARLRQSNAKESRVKVVALSRNFGKEIAVAAGLRYARGTVVILMDGDLQHPPEIIPQFIEGWRQGYDVVYGQRIDRHADSPMRRFFSKIFYSTFRVLSGTKLPPGAGDFRLLSRRAVDALNKFGERARFNKGLYAWIGFPSKGVAFDAPDRPLGHDSRWSMRALLRFALDGFASFTTVPLRIWSYLGLAVSLFAFTYIAIFAVKTFIYGTDQAGYPTLIISIMFFAGIQLVSLGVIGEYLGRIHEEVKARPLYLVADEIGFDGSAPAIEEPADLDGNAAQ